MKLDKMDKTVRITFDFTSILSKSYDAVIAYFPRVKFN